ncbi:MAG TPA: hypothetical protein VGB07_17310 [Blastocatellia bacterium]
MKTQGKWNVVIRLFALTLTLMLSLAAVSVAHDRIGDKTPEPAKTADAGNQVELKCSVSGNDIKLVTMTNHTDRVIAKGTAINFAPNTGIETTQRLRKNLKPGKTTIVHLGKFVGNSCRCRLIQ